MSGITGNTLQHMAETEALRQSKNKQRSDTDKKGRNRRKGATRGGQQIEMYTQINTKSRDRKCKQQEELTGCDVEGHRVSAKLVGGIAESDDVSGDRDADHTPNALLGLHLGCCLQILAQEHTVNTEKKAGPPAENASLSSAWVRSDTFCHRLKKGASSV